MTAEFFFPICSLFVPTTRRVSRFRGTKNDGGKNAQARINGVFAFVVTKNKGPSFALTFRHGKFQFQECTVGPVGAGRGCEWLGKLVGARHCAGRGASLAATRVVDCSSRASTGMWACVSHAGRGYSFPQMGVTALNTTDADVMYTHPCVFNGFALTLVGRTPCMLSSCLRPQVHYALCGRLLPMFTDVVCSIFPCPPPVLRPESTAVLQRV